MGEGSLPAPIELVAYTGMRIEETMVLKFSDIVLDNDGNVQHLIGTDLKFERAHNWNNTKAPKKSYDSNLN